MRLKSECSSCFLSKSSAIVDNDISKLFGVAKFNTLSRATFFVPVCNVAGVKCQLIRVNTTECVTNDANLRWLPGRGR